MDDDNTISPKSKIEYLCGVSVFVIIHMSENIQFGYKIKDP